MATMDKSRLPELHMYDIHDKFPPHFYYQVEAFSRIVWGENPEAEDDLDAGLDEPVQRFVVARGKRLISYASVCYVELELDGVRYHCGGVGGVMTFPAFRRSGYGGQVVQAATESIQQSPTVDIGLLWTDPKNKSFYNRYGWESLPGLITLIGNPAVPYDNELRMMIFTSEKGKKARTAFEHGQIHVGSDHW